MTSALALDPNINSILMERNNIQDSLVDQLSLSAFLIFNIFQTMNDTVTPVEQRLKAAGKQLIANNARFYISGLNELLLHGSTHTTIYD